MTEQSKPKAHFADLLWDIWCCASVIGIWPRFIEPNLLATTNLKLPVKGLPADLEDFSILQISDLHLHPRVPNSFLRRILTRAKKLKPDLIVFTGDFLCFSTLQEEKRLADFLKGLDAPFGCYAILGNHDYASSVSVNEAGDYDLIDLNSSLISKGFSRFFKEAELTGKTTARVREIGPHEELLQLLKDTPFELLDNKHKLLRVKGTKLNLVGLGEHMLGRCAPEKAFQGYDPEFPGLVLSHNPDSVPTLEPYPGEIILCGHTHGAQVNLPFLWKKFVLMEQVKFKRGLVRHHGKWVYVNRGVGSAMPFRWFALPELLYLKLGRA